jgi:uncharacterized protein (DUF736 family)
MSNYQPKDMTGSLFRNDRKERDTHPDYKGSALINGVDHWLDAWINEDRNGNKYMSLKLKPKEARQSYSGSYNGDPATNRSGSVSQADLDDEIPF